MNSKISFPIFHICIAARVIEINKIIIGDAFSIVMCYIPKRITFMKEVAVLLVIVM